MSGAAPRLAWVLATLLAAAASERHTPPPAVPGQQLLHCRFADATRKPRFARCSRPDREEPLLLLNEDGAVGVSSDVDADRSGFAADGQAWLRMRVLLPAPGCVVCRRQEDVGPPEHCLACEGARFEAGFGAPAGPRAAGAPRYVSGGVRTVGADEFFFCRFRVPRNGTLRTAWLSPACRFAADASGAASPRDAVGGCEATPSYRLPRRLGGHVETWARVKAGDVCRVCLAGTDEATAVGHVCRPSDPVVVAVEGLAVVVWLGGLACLVYAAVRLLMAVEMLRRAFRRAAAVGVVTLRRCCGSGGLPWD